MSEHISSQDNTEPEQLKWARRAFDVLDSVDWGTWRQKAAVLGTTGLITAGIYYHNGAPEEQTFAVPEGCEVSDDLVEESYNLRMNGSVDSKSKGDDGAAIANASGTPTVVGNLNNIEASTNTERALGLFLTEVEYRGVSTLPRSGIDIHYYTNQDEVINPEAAETLFAFGLEADFEDPLAAPVLGCHDEFMFEDQRYSESEISFVFIVDDDLEYRGLAISNEHVVILSSTSEIIASNSQYQDVKEVAARLPERPTIFMTAPSTELIEDIWVHESNHMRGYLADNRVITRLPEMEDEAKTVERAAEDYYGSNWPDLLVPVN